MSLNKYIVAFDTETTGLSQKDDFIIQLSAIKFEKDSGVIIKEFNKYIKPIRDYIITKGAFEAHGLTHEFIDRVGVPLRSVAREFLDMFVDADVLTFNGNRFDTNILYKDLQLIGLDFDFDGKTFYDSYSMEVRLAPRNLSAVFKKYMGYEFENAHDSLNDVKATIDIFMKQRELIGSDIDSWPENQLISPEGSIRNIADPGEPEIYVFSMGKYKDVDFMDVCKKDPQYIYWFKDKVASPYTWRLLTKYYKSRR